MVDDVRLATARPAVTSPRRRLARADRAAQLVDIAEVVFAERGIQATSVEEIAVAAGVTKPVVYDHFGSKDGLVAAVVDRAGQALYDVVVTAVGAAATPERALADGIEAYLGFMHERRRSWLSLLTETAISTEAAVALERVRERQGELIAALVSADVPGCGIDRARTYAQIVIGASERLATRPSAQIGSPRSLTRHLMDVLWCGFAEVRDGSRWHPDDA